MPQIPPEMLISLALFALASSITPGPNNTMLMASAANFGFRRTLPHLFGVNLGFFALVLSVGLALGGVFAAWPGLHQAMRLLGAAYLLFLAWKTATADGPPGARGSGRPQTFWQAVAFQWVNPKAWSMALGAIAAYVPAQGYAANLVLAALVFTLVNLPCVASWAGFGLALRGLLADRRRLRLFNWAMGALLAASLVPVLLEAL